MVRFGKRSNLSPRYVGPFEIVERVSPVAYRLRLPQELVGVHDTFHVSNLKKYLADVNLHVPLEEVKVDDKLHFVEEPIEILDRGVKKFKRRRIPIVKVRWNSRRGPDLTWEREDEMKRKYPHLFASATVNDVVKLRALIDGKRVVVSEDVIRQDLRLDDADGVECQNLLRIAWNEFSCSMASAVICLVTGRKFNFSKYIFDSMYTSPALTQKVYANMRKVGKGFFGVETPLFATMLVQPPAVEEEDEVAVPNASTPPSPTSAPSPPP
uniref:Putative reverse transcriptase domain-containing protein n=1 Tax=Tanacetum cinerariifolium TaxID=118510 RepID=A0A6L2NN12_TANCI|nr:putative reverse transcriptase domain-containing protein [Tanacetum cinerariifolium]